MLIKTHVVIEKDSLGLCIEEHFENTCPVSDTSEMHILIQLSTAERKIRANLEVREVKKLNLKRQEGFLEAKLGWRVKSANS